MILHTLHCQRLGWKHSLPTGQVEGEDEEGGSWLGRSHLRPTRALSRQQARELPAAPADSARGFCAGHEMISGSEDIKVSLVAHRAQQHSPFAPRGTA